jgi:hypothetical protein
MLALAFNCAAPSGVPCVIAAGAGHVTVGVVFVGGGGGATKVTSGADYISDYGPRYFQ